VAPADRAHFNTVTQQHFTEIFSAADTTSVDVYAATLAVLKQDPQLAKYSNPV
jgi:hypothetical protein